jgi:hypothetical protein
MTVGFVGTTSQIKTPNIFVGKLTQIADWPSIKLKQQFAKNSTNFKNNSCDRDNNYDHEIH